ncbi:ABC transporter substrate-binding protein [Cytobacillus purgationiresistens]|uniref:Spermidine/putrescine transport system substrate-binding protein n=1 Tax=Cytobacillus purgationiresistens TaxID=863449 RepID=A0ABU0AEY9_9BACI|nr:ABC transporter substrate-binding protein [Cytobacillus purgationiresistens]MDQ0269818.1 putative spermidine/putrescine transport system substrate-binding protein [Cytobacillus purgationiresistens]
MKRKLVSIVLTCLFLVIAAGCSGKSVGSSENGKKTLVLAAYGGSYEQKMKENLIPKFEEEHNVKVTYITGSSVDTLSKLQAQKGNPQIDVAFLDDGPQAQAKTFGLLAPLKEKLVPNLENLYDIAKDKDNIGVGFGIISTGLAYNKDVFEQNGWDPITSWNDLADAKFKGKIVLPSIANTYGVHTLLMTAIANGGSVENIDPGFEKMKEIAYNTVTFDKTADVSNYFLQGQAVASSWGSSRVYTLQDSGFPIEFVTPDEGAPALMATVSVVKGAPNEELAQKFVNFVLDEEAQKLFAASLFDGPVNKHVELEEEIANKVVYGEDEIEKLVKVDWELVNTKREEWTERANKEIEISH